MQGQKIVLSIQIRGGVFIMDGAFEGSDRRDFVRLDYQAPLNYKVCKTETVSKLLSGYTSNVSSSGILCRIADRVNIDDILWLSFDRGALGICSELEKNALIYQSGVIGKVVRVLPADTGDFQVGVRFLTREEENSTHVYPKEHFVERKSQ